MLARVVEATGIATVVVTMMPILAEKRGAPRIVGVPFPFGQAFGMPHDEAMQEAVAVAAIDHLAGAEGPGARVDIDIEWPVALGDAYKAWQPPAPSPIVLHHLDRIRAARRDAPPESRIAAGGKDT
ncbi:MAG: hypothetical protein ACE5GC_00315 [Acidimicrobiia bacterium]